MTTLTRSSVPGMLWLGILLFSGCTTPPGGKAPALEANLLGSWVSDDDGFRSIMTFQDGGRFEMHSMMTDEPFEEPPRYDGGGKWRVAGDTLILSGITHEPSTFGAKSGHAIISITGDVMTMTEVEPNEVEVMRRTDWHPPVLSTALVMKDYYETLTEAGRIVLTPRKTEGRPGDRIAIQVSLTNTDTQSYYVPVDLADRVVLVVEENESLPEGVVRLMMYEPPSVPRRSRSRLLAPGETISSAVVFKVPAKPGRVNLKAWVWGNERAAATDVPFRVLPAEAP